MVRAVNETLTARPISWFGIVTNDGAYFCTCWRNGRYGTADILELGATRPAASSNEPLLAHRGSGVGCCVALDTEVRGGRIAHYLQPGKASVLIP